MDRKRLLFEPGVCVFGSWPGMGVGLGGGVGGLLVSLVPMREEKR